MFESTIELLNLAQKILSEFKESINECDNVLRKDGVIYSINKSHAQWHDKIDFILVWDERQKELPPFFGFKTISIKDIQSVIHVS